MNHFYMWTECYLWLSSIASIRWPNQMLFRAKTNTIIQRCWPNVRFYRYPGFSFFGSFASFAFAPKQLCSLCQHCVCTSYIRCTGIRFFFGYRLCCHIPPSKRFNIAFPSNSTNIPYHVSHIQNIPPCPVRTPHN